MAHNVIVFDYHRLDDGILIDGVSMDDLRVLLQLVDGQIQLYNAPNSLVEQTLNVPEESLENVRELVKSYYQTCLKIKSAILEAFPELI